MGFQTSEEGTLTQNLCEKEGVKIKIGPTLTTYGVLIGITGRKTEEGQCSEREKVKQNL